MKNDKINSKVLIFIKIEAEKEVRAYISGNCHNHHRRIFI